MHSIAGPARLSASPKICVSSPRITSALPSGRSQDRPGTIRAGRSEEHTSELQSLMRISYAVFCLKKKKHEQSSYMSYVKYMSFLYHILTSDSHYSIPSIYV